jgi:hypothetical protein
VVTGGGLLGDCLAGSEVTAFVAVYDPAAGFVTVGGWIMYPAGAYTANPDLTGKATFGFVAKYKKGANVPDGNTEFQNKAGDLNFKSTSYDWLVVAGMKAHFKGVVQSMVQAPTVLCSRPLMAARMSSVLKSGMY